MIPYCDMLHMCGVFGAGLFVNLYFRNDIRAESVLILISHEKQHALKRNVQYTLGETCYCVYSPSDGIILDLPITFTQGVEVGARAQMSRQRQASLEFLM